MVFDQRNGKFDQVPSFKQKPFVRRVAFVRVFAVCGKFSMIRLPKTDFFCFLICFLSFHLHSFALNFGAFIKKEIPAFKKANAPSL